MTLMFALVLVLVFALGFGFCLGFWLLPWIFALGIGKQERRATASLLAMSGSRYRGERSEKPDRRERPDYPAALLQH
jgi:hypothetical protein